MSHEASTWAYAQQGLKMGAKFVLVTLADLADEEHSCYPGVSKIAQRTGASRSAVIEYIKTLVDAGLITKERRERKNGGRSSNRYYLTVREPSALTPESGLGQGHSPDSGRGSGDPKSRIRTEGGPDSGRGKVQNLDGRFTDPSDVNHQNEPSEVNGDDTEFALIANDEIPPADPDPSFGYFWSIWPRHDGKKAALAAWAKAIKRAPAGDILGAAHAYATSPWRPERQFVPHASTWLNGDRWDDPPPGPPEQRAAPPSPAHRPAVQAGLDLVAQFAQEEAHESHRDRAALDRGGDPRRYPA